MSINRVNFTGRIAREPDFRTTNTSNIPVMNLDVCITDRKRNPQSGVWENRPNFIECVMFGSRVNHLSKVLAKGSLIAAEGKLRQVKWVNNGEIRNKVQVVLDDIDFISYSNNYNSNKQLNSYEEDHIEEIPSKDDSQESSDD